MASAEVTKLRSIVADAQSKNLLTSAIFFCERLVFVSEDQDDIYTLAQLYFLSLQYKRALHTLKQLSSSSNQRFRLLHAQCLAACKNWDECLTVLGDSDVEDAMLTDSAEAAEILAAVALLRGRVYDAQQNRAKAAHWYKQALRRDVHCYEAFEQLVETHMLTVVEEVELMASLQFGSDDEWLQQFYASKLRKPQPVDPPVIHGRAGKGCDVHTATAHAEHLFRHHDFSACYVESQRVLEQHPYAITILPLHVSTLVQLKRQSELFGLAHRLVDDYPTMAIAWYATGCYYLLTEKHDQARRYLHKATTIDPYFAPAWIALGHSMSTQDESDQAMTAYRTAARHFGGCHLPPLCIGMEYLRTNNLQLAELFFAQSNEICPTDPVVHNELGVILFRNHEFKNAIAAFERALSLSNDYTSESSEPTLYNLGHCHRKMRDFPKALQYYEAALTAKPKSASTYSAIGFTHHLAGSIDLAIDFYHKALGVQGDDTFTTDMLSRALEDGCLLFSK